MKVIMKNFVKHAALGLGIMAVSCSGESTVTTEDSAVSEAFSDELTLVVSGTDESSCTVTGDQGTKRGSGSPDSVTYEVGTEEYVTVHCGEMSARIAVGTDAVTLTDATTNEAELFGNLTHVPGTAMIANLIASLNEEAASENLSVATINSATQPRSLTSSSAANMVAGSLEDFMETLDDLLGGVNTSNRQTQVINLLINMGIPVVIENVGAGQTISECSDTVAATFAENAISADASEIGLSGCLIYHRLFAMTDLNNPAGVPQVNNVVDSLRAVATESGVVAELVESFTDGRTFNLGSLYTYLYTSAGYSGYTENDEGEVTDREPTEDEIEEYFSDFLSGENIDDWSAEDERFHAGYNPSGGWAYDTIAEDFTDEIPWNAACYDSDGSSLDDCPIDPIRFDFDGTTLTENPDGDYVLQLRYQGDGFTTTPRVVEYATSRPYRDDFYQPVTVDFDPNEYNTRYLINELHADGLDPMSDGTDSAPYSNATWRELYPEMQLVDNVYVHGATEVSARLMVIINTIKNLDSMSALRAFTLSRVMMGAMAGLPVDGDTTIIPVDHEMTVANWEDTTTTWLASGTVVAHATGTGKIQLKNTAITFPGTQKCVNSTNGKSENCTFTPVTFKYSKTVSETRSNGDKTYALSGSFKIKGNQFGGPYTYTPTLLVVNSAGTKAWFEGDTDVVYYNFTGQNLHTKIQAGTTTQSATTYKFLAQ